MTFSDLFDPFRNKSDAFATQFRRRFFDAQIDVGQVASDSLRHNLINEKQSLKIKLENVVWFLFCDLF